MYTLIRRMLFSLQAENAHNLTLKVLQYAGKAPFNHCLHHYYNAVGQEKMCMGIRFKNPIGLAAGADKNGEAIDGFATLGFGFIEVGTVTPLAQDGNPKPRQFRIIEAEGIINRNGFNNNGIDYLIENIKKAKYTGTLGINIGKNTFTPVEYGKDDYLTCLNKAYSYADYITINISSPNSPGLRKLQYGELLDDLLRAIKNKQAELNQQYTKYVPIAVKIAPDLTESELIAIADSLLRHNIDAVIATNTTLEREMVKGLTNAEQQGGLSGKPLQNLSTQIIARLAKELQGNIPIIGSGGISSVENAKEKIAAGAELLQLYSGLIYSGPKLVQDLIKNIG